MEIFGKKHVNKKIQTEKQRMGPGKMHRDPAVCGRAFRLFIRGRHGGVRPVEKTAFFTARMDFSGSVDDFVHIDGDRVLADLGFRSGKAECVLRADGLRQAAVCQFLLAGVFL